MTGDAPARWTREELSLARIVALGLAEPVGTPLEVVGHLGALQAQDLPGSLLSVALRTPSRSLAEVVSAFDDGRLVRTWSMRHTLHTIPATDLGWILALTSARMESGAAARHRSLGIDQELVARARAVAEDLFASQPTASRAELFAAWDAHDLLQGVAQRGVHLVSILCRSQVLVWGPLRATRTGWEHLLVPVDGWVRREELDADEALARWSRSFFTSHGPATEADFARWTGLGLRATRRGLAANPDLLRVERDGEVLVMAPELPDRVTTLRHEAGFLHLLPGFDELLLGYRDRSVTCPAPFAQAICPGNNGMFRHTVVVEGQVAGTWRKGTATRQEPRPAPVVTWLREPTAAELDALGAAAGRLPR